MVSRAMSNFGHERLVLIEPLCELDRQANKGAAQGQQPLRDVVIYQSWEDYAEQEPDGPRIAYSRRDGRRRPGPVSLIFGTEDHGLSRDDLKWAHRTCTLEIPGPLKSMNLSHAVLLALSQLPDFSPHTKAEPAPVQTPDEDLQRWLTALNFDLSSKNWNAFYSMRQMLMKANPTKREMELFHAVIEQTLRKIEQRDNAE